MGEKPSCNESLLKTPLGQGVVTEPLKGVSELLTL